MPREGRERRGQGSPILCYSIRGSGSSGGRCPQTSCLSRWDLRRLMLTTRKSDPRRGSGCNSCPQRGSSPPSWTWRVRRSSTAVDSHRSCSTSLSPCERTTDISSHTITDNTTNQTVSAKGCFENCFQLVWERMRRCQHNCFFPLPVGKAGPNSFPTSIGYSACGGVALASPQAM